MPSRPAPVTPPDPELLEARAEIFGTVFVVVQHLARRADAELADIGLTARQWLLLAVLQKWFPGRDPSLTEAAERYGSSRQNVKQIALGLEEGGFLRLLPDPADGRTTRLRLTPKVGLFDEPAVATRATAMLADATAGLTREETLALRSLVRRWLAGVTEPGAGVTSRRAAGSHTREGV